MTAEAVDPRLIAVSTSRSKTLSGSVSLRPLLLSPALSTEAAGRGPDARRMAARGPIGLGGPAGVGRRPDRRDGGTRPRRVGPGRGSAAGPAAAAGGQLAESGQVAGGGGFRAGAGGGRPGPDAAGGTWGRLFRARAPPEAGRGRRPWPAGPGGPVGARGRCHAGPLGAGADAGSGDRAHSGEVDRADCPARGPFRRLAAGRRGAPRGRGARHIWFDVRST